MRLEPLYRMEFDYPEGWSVSPGDPRFVWLNDVVCVGTGEVGPDSLHIDVAELVWEPSSGPMG